MGALLDGTHSRLAMTMLVGSAVALIIATLLDFEFRLRMTRLGHKWVFFQGGAFNYSRYHNIRKEHGWPAWPVYVMWVMYICGIGLLIAGMFAFLGTSAHRS